MKTCRNILFTYFLFSSFVSFAQENNTVIKNDSTYVGYEIQMKQLTFKQDSIQDIIKYYRELAEKNVENNDAYVDLILNFEVELFDIQSGIGVLTTEISILKQEFILNALSQEDNSVSSVIVSENSLDYINEFLKNNLSEEEVELVESNTNIDSLAGITFKKVSENYSKFERLDSLLRVTRDKYIADSLYLLAEDYEEFAISAEAEFEEVWIPLYDTKLYAYKRILDILNTEQYLQYDLDAKEKELSRDFDIAEQSVFSPVLHLYSRQRNLLMEYELLIARKKGDARTIEYLTKLKDSNISFGGSNIELLDWKYIDYSNIKFSSKPIYGTRNPIPYVSLPTKESIYNIRVMVLSAPLTNFKSLRGAFPATYYVNENGKYEYYLGVYKTLEEAKGVIKTLRLKGFRAPVVTEWRDGGKVTDGGVIVPLHVNDYTYSIELDMLTPDLTKIAKKLAPKKTFVKINNKYVLGSFEKYTQAIKVKQAMGIGANIVGVLK